MELDVKDCALLAALQEEGDLANVELARRVQLSPAATLRRVQRLRAAGAIAAIRATVPPERVGLDVEAFVMATLAEHTDAADSGLAAALAEHPEVLRADAISGNHDVLLHVAVPNVAALQQLLLALQRAGAARVTTMLRLTAIKHPSPTPALPSGSVRSTV